MFKNLINLWKGKDFLAQVLSDFENMLNSAETMFAMVCKRLLGEGEDSGLKDKIYDIDRTINASEKNIRRRIIEHLSFQPAADIPVSLVLMSVVKDAERLGDYSKNLFEVSELLEKPFEKEFFKEMFDEMDEKIIAVFQKTKKAFLESDEKAADEIMGFEREIIKRCDAGLEKLTKSKLQTNQAVCATLAFRYFKRICAHLGNIASSVIMPVTDLDYFDEKRRHDTI
jgi:phosphate uptake regulator